MDTQDKVIDGLNFSVTQLPGRKGSRLFTRLMRAIGPSIGLALGEVGEGVTSIADLDVSKVMAALGKSLPRLVEDLKPEEIEGIQDALFETASVDIDGRRFQVKDKFDVIFKGKPLAVYKLMYFAIEVNFGFFGEGGLGSLVEKVRSSLSASAKTSPETGPSGDSSSTA